MKQDNTYIYEMDFIKLIFTLMVVLYHFGMMHGNLILGGGYLAVDFFFMVSGYLMRNSIEKYISPKDSLWECFKKIIGKRFLNLYLEFILAWSLSFFLAHNLSDETTWLSDFWAAKQEVLLIHLFGIYSEKGYLSPAWYLSAMFIAMTIILPFLIRRKDGFTYYCPIIALIIYTIFSQTLGHGRGQGDYLFLTTYGVYRAIAGLCLGNLAFEIVQKIKRTIYSNRYVKIIITVIIYSIILFLLYRFHEEYLTQNDFGYIFMIFIVVVLVMSGVSYSNTFWARLGLKLDKFNLALYLNHDYLLVLPILYKIESFGERLTVYLLITIFVSFGMALLTNGLRFVYTQTLRKG